MKPNHSSPHPQWALAHKKPGTELRCIRGKYYLYEYKTVYDPIKKKAKKISGPLLGSITEKDGFIPSPKRVVNIGLSEKVKSPILVKEFGNVHLIHQKFSLYQTRLEKYFGDMWAEIIAIAYCRFVYHCPLKNIPFRIDGSFLNETYNLPHFTEKTASGILNKLGDKQADIQNYMRSFIHKGDYILMDGTQIFSKSKHIQIATKGYNKSNNFDGQVNLLYVYSANMRMPVYYRLLSGNIRDVKAFKNTLLEAGLKKAIVVADKGFYSKANIELLLEEELSFIIPLKRDNSLIDYSEIADNSFKNIASFFQHEKRIIWHMSFDHGQQILHLFLDDSLKNKEEMDYLTRISNNPETNTLEKYYEKRNCFGTIALITDKSITDSQDAYETYKSRMYIETMFDGMKNVLEADHTYMQNEQTLQGWMFINHLCLQWYQELYLELKAKDLIKKISVKDYIQALTDIKKIKINDQWHLNEFTKATAKLVKAVGVDI